MFFSHRLSKFGPQIKYSGSPSSGLAPSTHADLHLRLDHLKHSISSAQATESLFTLQQFDMIIQRVQSLGNDDPNWPSMLPRILELVSLHDGLVQTDSWDDFGVTKKADVLTVLYKLREKIYHLPYPQTS